MPTIMIDAGHGGTQAIGRSTPVGAIGPTGLREKDVTLDVARRLSARLGSGALLTRTEDRNLSLAQRAEMARRSATDVFLSIHANAGPAEMCGPEVWVHDKANSASLALAQQIAGELKRLGGPASIHRGPMSVLSPERHARGTAACLVEIDYLSNPAVERRLRDPAALAVVAAALADGVLGGGRRYGDAATLDETWSNRLAKCIPNETLDTKMLFYPDNLAIDAIGALFGTDSWNKVVDYITGEQELDKKLIEVLENIDRIPGGELIKAIGAAMAGLLLVELVPLGLPYQKIWGDLAEDHGKTGFAVGVVWAADDRSPAELRQAPHNQFWNYGISGGDDVMKRIALYSNRMGILAGLASGRQLTTTQKENLFADLQFRDEARAHLVDWSLRDNPRRPDDFYFNASIAFHAFHL